MSAIPDEPAGESAHPFADHLRLTAELARLAGAHDLGKATPGLREAVERVEAAASGSVGNVRTPGRARKVSVSMPEDLTVAVQRRVGRGQFSHYVTQAVARQLELDLLNELTGLLEAEYGPVPEELLAEAAAAWPDVE